MNPEIRQAWLTAGDWVIANWPWIATAFAAAIAWWAIGQCLPGGDYRSRNDKAAAWRLLCDNPPNRETQPGSDADDLRTCLQILRATDTREEDTRG